MNYFFGFDNTLSNNIDWFFNLNHLFLILFVAGFVVLCSFLLYAKSQKGRKITKIVLASILFVLEIGRIVYDFLLHKHNGGTAENFNWWWTFSFQMCAIMTWTTIVTLLLSAFIKKENKFLQFLYNILFGCAMIGGILTFCYPDCITANYPFLHFINIQTVITHSLLIFVPIYLIKIKDFKVEIKNIWKVCAGYVYIGCVSMSASLISGNNFAYALELNLVDLGIPFPWHLPLLMIVLVAFASLFYGAFELARYIKRGKASEKVEEEMVAHKDHFGMALYVLANITSILFGALILLGVACLIGQPSSWFGIFCLIGLAYMIVGLVFAEYLKRYIYEPFDYENKNKHILFIVLTIVLDLTLGVLYLVKFLQKNKDA